MAAITKVEKFALDDKDWLIKSVTQSLADHNLNWSTRAMLERVHAQNIAIGLTDDEKAVMADAETYEECALRIAVLGDHTKQRKELHDMISEQLVANGRSEMVSKIGSWLDVTPNNYTAVKNELSFVTTGLAITHWWPSLVPSDSVISAQMQQPISYASAFRSMY